MAESAFGSIVNSVISQSFTMSLSQERQAEIVKIGKCWDFYYGEQEQYIKRYLGEKQEEYDDKDKPTFNYTRAVVDEYVKGVFGQPVQYKFEKDAHQKIWESVFDPLTFTKISPFFMKTQRISEVSNTCLVMIRYDDEKGKPYFEDIRGEFVSFLPKEGKAKEIGTVIISYNYDTGDPDPEKRILKRVEIWDENKWEIWLQSPFTGFEKLMDSGDNPYGFIPGEVFRPEEDDNSLYGITNVVDVTNVNEIYNNLWTVLMRICVFQSFSILYVKSENDITLEVAPTRMLTLPESVDGDASYLTPSPKIAEVAKVLNDLKSELENVAHVPEQVLSSSKALSPESGYALRIKRVPIEQQWEKRRLSYGPSLKDLAKKTVLCDEVKKGSTSKEKARDAEVPVNITFTDTVPPLSPQEQILTDEQNMRYGLITPVDLMIRKDPTLNREDAKKQIEANQKEIEELGFQQFGQDNETEFQRLKVKMGRKEAGIEESVE